MEELKQLAKRKIIVLAMIARCLLIVWSIITTFTNTMAYEHFAFPYGSILLSIVRLVGMVIIILWLQKNKKDITLLIGVGIIVFLQLLSLFTNFNFYNILNFIAWIAIGLLTIMVVMPDKIPELKKLIAYSNIIGLVAVVLLVFTNIISFLITIFTVIEYFAIASIFIYLVSNIIEIVLTFLSYGLFAIYLSNLAQGEEELDIDISNVTDGSSKTASEITSGPMAMSLGLHVVLLLCTCGIWLYIWIYKVTGYLNKESEEKRNPVNKLLLCMFIPFYYIYWVYKSCQIIDSMYKSRGKHSDISTMCLILAIFVNIVPPIIMQDKINALENEEVSTTANTTQATENQNTNSYSSDADEIREYKKLLDEGLITEEDYEAKKKQIMGL